MWSEFMHLLPPWSLLVRVLARRRQAEKQIRRQTSRGRVKAVGWLNLANKIEWPGARVMTGGTSAYEVFALSR